MRYSPRYPPIGLSRLLLVCLVLFPPGVAAAQQNPAAPGSASSPQLDARILRQDLDETRQRLLDLGKRQDDNLQSMVDLFRTSLTAFAILGTLISVMTALQVLNDSRIMKMLKAELEEGKKTADLYRQNMATVTGLINSLKSIFEFQQQADVLRKQVEDVKTDNEAVRSDRERDLETLNQSAVQISLRTKRNSINDTAYQRIVREFAEDYRRLGSATEGKVNANCTYLLGLNARVQNDYDQAQELFEEAIRQSMQHPSQPDAQAFYHSLPNSTPLTTWLGKLGNICHYHLALLLYNRGQYAPAREHWTSATQLDPKDYKSHIYIPEAEYLGGLAPFDAIVGRFRDVITRLTSLTPDDTRGFAEPKNKLLAQAHLKLGNCYFGGSRDPDLSRHRDLSVALSEYLTAAELDPGWAIAEFSVAQALHACREGGVRIPAGVSTDYQCRFARVFEQIKTFVGSTTEAKILMMYYFMLAIAATYGDVEAELAPLYLLRVQELRSDLPRVQDLRIFSPFTKRDLPVREFLKEVEEFEAVPSAGQPAGGSASRLSRLVRR